MPFLNGATVVFDLDGTLVDTAPDLIGTLNLLLVEDGLPPVALHAARTLVGHGARAMLRHGFETAGAALSQNREDDLLDRFITVYRGRIAKESRPFDGLETALDALSGAGATLAVCTNKRTGLSVALLDALNLSPRFAAIVGSDSAPAAKPDPRHLFTAIAAAGGEPGRTVFVGDSETDAATAKAARVPIVGVSFGYTLIPPPEIGFDILIDTLDDLPAAARDLLARAA